jgi:hypothetical protein
MLMFVIVFVAQADYDNLIGHDTRNHNRDGSLCLSVRH